MGGGGRERERERERGGGEEWTMEGTSHKAFFSCAVTSSKYINLSTLCNFAFCLYGTSIPHQETFSGILLIFVQPVYKLYASFMVLAYQVLL